MPTSSSIIASLREERAAIQSFLELLGEEQLALIRGDADLIASGIERKSQWLEKLTRYATQRGEFLKQQKLPVDRKSMEKWITSHADAATLTAEWHELLEITHQAWQVNQANGLLISVQLQANQQALTTLAAAAHTGNIYGRDGQAVGPWGSRMLGTA